MKENCTKTEQYGTKLGIRKKKPRTKVTLYKITLNRNRNKLWLTNA